MDWVEALPFLLLVSPLALLVGLLLKAMVLG
jgi:hypothetical protein